MARAKTPGTPGVERRLGRFGNAAGWALGGALAAVILRAALHPILGADLPFITLFPAVALVALAGGWGAGLACLVTAAPLLVVLFVPSAETTQGQHTLGLVLAIAVSLLLIAVAASHRRLRLNSDLAAAEAQRTAESLRDSEERFRRLAELSPDGILVIAGGRVVYANPATLRLLRATDASQVLGHSPLEQVHPESSAMVEERLERLLATGKPNPPIEYRYSRFDGAPIIVEASSTLVPWQGVSAVQVIARDVTERKATEEELQYKQRELEDFFENAPVPIKWVAADGRILRANRAELEFMGYPPGEYIGRRSPEFHVDTHRAEELLQRLLRGQTLCREEVMLRRHNGDIRTVLLDANGLWRGGSLVYVRCFTNDVTEQRRTQEEVQAALDRFRLCARATNEPIYDWDLERNRIEWSEAMSSLIGEEAPRESSIDWWRERIHPDDLEQTEHDMKAALGGDDEGWTAEYRFRRADGSWAVTYDRAFIARDRSGRPVRMVGAMIDMTERKRWEEHLAHHAADLQRSNADLEDFARVIAHDLKAPLRGIADYSGYLVLDYANRLDEEGRDKLHTLLRLTQRMHDLLDGLMEYARVGRAALRLAETDLNTVLDEVLDSLRSWLETERVQVALETPLPGVRADPMLIQQVFSNLIINGLKYNTRSEKRIQIGCRRAEDDGEIIYIRDNGIGIEEKHRDSIFQMFRRLHGRDDFGGGTGSGLSIVRKIIERHGGHIWVESTVGEGSTFFFTLGQPRDNDPEPLIPVVRTQHDAPRPR